MTSPAPKEVQRWTDQTAVRRRQIGAALTLNVAAVAAVTVLRPSTPWLAFWWLATVVATAASMWVWRTQQRRAAWLDKSMAFWCWHWFTGARLVLVNNPELSWWRDLRACWPYLDVDRTEPCPRDERLTCWARRAGTATARTAATGALVVAEYLRSGAPAGTSPAVLAGVGAAGCLLLAVLLIAAAAVTVQVAMEKWWIRPLALALAELAGQPLAKRPRSWIKLDRKWQYGQRGVSIHLSPTYRAGNRAVLDDTLQQAYAKSGLSPADVDPDWDLLGHHRWLRLVPAKVIPDRVSFADDLPRQWFLDMANQHTPVFGAARGWQPYRRSLDSDAPHVLIIGPTLSGKSELARSTLAQLLWHNREIAGTRAEVWDPKLNSHVDLEQLVCVSYYRHLTDIAARCLAVADMAAKRGAAAVAAERTGDPTRFPPLFVLFEDTAQAVKWMHTHRRDRLHTNPDSPTFQDAIDAWDRILGLGRGVNIHVIACPHRPTVRALGGDVARDQFGLVFLMTGYGSGSLRLVDPSLRYEPLPPIKGRALALYGGDDTVIQSMWDEHRQMVGMLADVYGSRNEIPGQPEAVRGRVEDEMEGNGGGWEKPIELLSVRTSGGEPAPDDPVGPRGDRPLTRPHDNGGPRVVTLQEAWETGKIGQNVQFDTVKRQRTRTRDAIRQYDSPEEAEAAGWWFPPVVEYQPAPGGKFVELYEEGGLVRWWQSRKRAAPDDGEWWMYWVVEGGMEAVRYGAVVKIGYTDDLRQRLRAFGKHWAGNKVAGDVVYLERYPSKSAAAGREAELHRVYRAAFRDAPGVPPGKSLACWPQGQGGNGGRETFWIEGPLAVDMARHCPTRRDALRRQVVA